MITLIYGPKGSGKTKKIIDSANLATEQTKGNVVFIGDSKYSAQLNNKIRFFNCVEYHVSGKPMTVGFIKGILAGNYDITEFYIDGLHRITGFSAIDLRDVFDEIEYLSTQENVNFTIALSTDVLPQYLNKYI